MDLSKHKCNKCKTEATGGACWYNNAKVYTFCKLCFSFIKDKTDPNPDADVCDDFMKGIGLTKIDKAIIRARIKRAEGKSPWVKPLT